MADKKTQIKSKKSPFWLRVQELLGKARRKKGGVNLSRLAVLAKANQNVVVADKVLGTGKLAHAMTVAAPGFSAGAKKGIAAAGGKAMSIEQMQAAHPTGKDVIILI